MGRILIPGDVLSQPRGALRLRNDYGAPVACFLPATGVVNLCGGTVTVTGNIARGTDRGLEELRISNANRFTTSAKVNTSAFTFVTVVRAVTPTASGSTRALGQCAQNTTASDAASFDWSLIEAYSTDRFELHVSNGSTAVKAEATTGPTWPTAGWHRIAGSYDGTNARICIDDGPVFISASFTGGISSSYGICAGGYWANQTAYDPGIRIALLSVFSGHGANDGELRSLVRNPWHIFVPRRLYFGAGGGTTDVTVALTGSAVTSSAGTIVSNVAQTLSGTAVTTEAGTVTPVTGVTIALSGSAVTASAGTLSVAISNAITGSEVTTSAGTVTPSTGTFVALSGAAVTTSVGTLSVAVSCALSGSAVTASAGTVTNPGQSIWTDVGVSAATWSDVGSASSIWTDL